MKFMTYLLCLKHLLDNLQGGAWSLLNKIQSEMLSCMNLESGLNGEHASDKAFRDVVYILNFQYIKSLIENC